MLKIGESYLLKDIPSLNNVEGAIFKDNYGKKWVVENGEIIELELDKNNERIKITNTYKLEFLMDKLILKYIGVRSVNSLNCDNLDDLINKLKDIKTNFGNMKISKLDINFESSKGEYIYDK